MAITHVQHVDIFHIIYKHYKRIGRRYANLKGKRTDLFASALRVLELMREEQIKVLLASGVAEEDITEEMLGFAMTWEHFHDRAAEHYGRRSFEGIIEFVLTSGAAARRYVECHRRKREDGREELLLVRDENGPITYATIDEARENRLSGGDVINYFYFNAKAVNDLTAEIYNLAKPTPQPPTGGNPGTKGTKKGGAQRDLQFAEQPPAAREDKTERAGNPVRDSSSCNENMIHHASQNSEGLGARYQHGTNTASQNSTGATEQSGDGSQNYGGTARKTAGEGSQKGEENPRKTASNKNLIKEVLESPEEIIISAPGAIDLVLSQFDFSQPVTPQAILQLSRILLPPLPTKYKTEEDKEAAYAKVDAAAQILAERPLIQELGLRNVAARLAYLGDESSPCRYRAHCRAGGAGRPPNPGVKMRLNHLESETVFRTLSQEMEKSGWWPDYLPKPAGLVETPPEIDLAELAGIDASDRVGMDAETAEFVADWLANMLESHGYPYEVRLRRLSPVLDRGHAIEVWFEHEDGTRRVLRFYRFDDWDMVVDAQEATSWGSLEFVHHLGEAVRRAWVA